MCNEQPGTNTHVGDMAWVCDVVMLYLNCDDHKNDGSSKDAVPASQLRFQFHSDDPERDLSQDKQGDGPA